MKVRIFILTLILSSLTVFSQEQWKSKFEKIIPVLNVGTFHMGYTPDASTVEFDEHDRENVKRVHEVAEAIARFKPTVIVVEMPASQNVDLHTSYTRYVNDPEMAFDAPDEIELLAFEVGRLSGAKKIFGIDYAEGYNYEIGYILPDYADKETFTRYMNEWGAAASAIEREVTDVRELLRLTNEPVYLDFLLNINADILTHVATEGKHQGADEAAKFYHRNLVMYSNLNQLPLTPDDRVFILMGATHTAFFNAWLDRSPKYERVDVMEYLVTKNKE